MSDRTWTPEPWTTFNDGTAFGVWRGITTLHPIAMEVALEDAARAVACVNACAGMADPAAEIARLRKDAATLAREVEAWRAYDKQLFNANIGAKERDPQFWESLRDKTQATDASGALTRHKEATL